MNKNVIENNKIEITGEITSSFEFSHEIFGEKFYIASLSSERTSGNKDVLQILVSDRMIDMNYEWKGQFVRITGQIRTHNKRVDGKNKLNIYVFANEVEAMEGVYHENYAFIEGYVCRNPNYRTTPLGRDITDLLIAINRRYSKSDYIPCICWGRNAIFSSVMEVGTRVRINGRFQSREYIKKHDDGTSEPMIAYELSANTIKIVEDSEE